MHRHSRNYRCRLRGKCDGMEPLDLELTNKNMRNITCSISRGVSDLMLSSNSEMDYCSAVHKKIQSFREISIWSD